MELRGLSAPLLNVPLIELRALDGEVIDLYNESYLESVELSGDALAFSFRSIPPGRVFAVTFEGVTDLLVVEPEDWVEEEGHQIDHLLVRPDGPWRSVVFKAGGREYEFDCAAMVLAIS